MQHLFQKLSTSRTGIAATEFAIIAPVLIVLMLGGFQLTLYANASRRIDLAVRSMSEMISQAVPPEGSTTATVNDKDLRFAHESVLVIFPQLMKDAKVKGISWAQDISINFASIIFKRKSPNCENAIDKSPCTKALVLWTSAGFGTLNYRSCDAPQQPANDTDAPSPNTLPRSVYSANSLIVVDIVFQFKPMIASNIIPSLKIARTAYVQPRYAAIIEFDPAGNAGDVKKCSDI